MNFEELLSPRIQKHCLPQYNNKHFIDAAREAMVQVELALKEKALVDEKLFGQALIDNLFTLGSKFQSIKLHVPLGDQLQDKAKALFKSVFAYYRNYAAHDGRNINQQQSARILIMASELLDLINASALSFEDLGGVEGILKLGGFTNKNELAQVLEILDELYLPDPDGASFRDVLLNDGFTDLLLDVVFDIGLLEYEETQYSPSVEELKLLGFDNIPNIIGGTKLTELGKKVKADGETI